VRCLDKISMTRRDFLRIKQLFTIWIRNAFGHVRVIGSEVFENNHRLSRAFVGNGNPGFCCCFAHKIFISTKLAEAKHYCSFRIIDTKLSMPLNYDTAVCCIIF